MAGLWQRLLFVAAPPPGMHKEVWRYREVAGVVRGAVSNKKEVIIYIVVLMMRKLERLFKIVSIKQEMCNLQFCSLPVALLAPRPILRHSRFCGACEPIMVYGGAWSCWDLVSARSCA